VYYILDLLIKTTPYMQWRFSATFMFHFVTFCYKISLS